MVKVLYVVGTSRCGSTLLSNVLGEFDGFFAAGETRFLWERGLHDRLCGCQTPVRECPVWGSVLSSEEWDVHRIEILSASQRRVLRLHHTPRLLRSSPDRLLRSSVLSRYVDAMTEVYGRLAGITESRVIVDSSGRPSNAAVLRLVRGVDPYVLHLVRDPRGVAYSRARPKPSPEGSLALSDNPTWYSAVDWMATNLAAEDVRRRFGRGRSIFVRYEDFVARPKATIDSIVGFLGETPSHDPFLEPRTVDLRANHMVSGNPDRFQQGPIQIRQDASWREGMRPIDRLLVTGMTAPLDLRYGYELLPRTHDRVAGSAAPRS
jgi:hypothetical protein